MYRDLSPCAILRGKVNTPFCWSNWRKESADIKSPNLLSFNSYSPIILPSRHCFEDIRFPKNNRNGRHQMP
jgi:hypothetical protein